METRRVVLRGGVQGVNCRWAVRRLAEGLGVKGTVRNAADDSVEVVAQANTKTLDEFEKGLKALPFPVRVGSLESEKIKLRQEFDSFDIVY